MSGVSSTARAASFRPPIRPVPDGIARPLWSVMIPTFNCAGYLREALSSVLAQDPGPDVMQIEVVDDCSTMDDPGAVVAEIGGGRVQFHRRPQNGGHTANFRTCLERSRGHLVHLLHGDDAVRDGFYRRMQAGFDARPDIGAAFCRHVVVDEHNRPTWTSDLERRDSGVLENWLGRIAVGQLIQTPSIVVRRDVYEVLGTFDVRLSWVEDWEMWVRIAAHRPVWFEVEPLAVYRVHGTSNSSRLLRTGENLRDVRRAIDLIQDHLPEHARQEVRRRSLEHWARDVVENRLPGIIRSGDALTALVQAFEAVRCSRSPHVVWRLCRLLPAVAWLVLGRVFRASLEWMPFRSRGRPR
jgi:glycosyltransferase involved in cell wall biosynthesis